MPVWISALPLPSRVRRSSIAVSDVVRWTVLLRGRQRWWRWYVHATICASAVTTYIGAAARFDFRNDGRQVSS